MPATVESADGTTIAYETYGEGQPIICLHGTGVTRAIWDGLVAALREDALLVVPDRRGRGDSTDTEPYAFEREQEDVRALAEGLSTEADPILFGSSYAGLLAMATARDLPVAGLILNEPPLPAETVDDASRRSLADRMAEHLEADRREEAVRLFFTEAAGVRDVERLPIWPACIEFAETMVREAAIVESYRLADVEVTAPTLLLTGEHSPWYLGDGVDMLAETIADARVVEIEGAGHASIATAPARVAEAVREFLDRLASETSA